MNEKRGQNRLENRSLPPRNGHQKEEEAEEEEEEEESQRLAWIRSGSSRCVDLPL